jgi:hypothetical protein
MMALGAALTVCGTLMGQRIAGPTKSSTHLYIINLAPTGSGKDWPLQSGARVFDAVGKPGLIGVGGFASGPGFLKRVARDPLMWCPIDELGDELAKINAKGGGVWLTMTIGVLKECYNAFGTVATAEKVEEQSTRVHWPAVSILGAATPEKFFGSLQPGDLESGFANRLLILPYEHYKKAPEATPPDDADIVPAGLVAMLRRLPMRQAPGHAARMNTVVGAFTPRPLIRIAWGEGAADVYRAFSLEMDDLAEGDTRRYELSQRCAENAVRIATIIAVGRGSNVVDVPDLLHATDLARLSLDTACGGVDKYMQDYVNLPEVLRPHSRMVADATGWLRQ